jgi:hypothetical protein
MYAGVVAVLQGFSNRRFPALLGAAFCPLSMWGATLVALATSASPARADDKPNTTVLETEGIAPPPPPRQAQIEYGVAFTVEGVAHAGPICANTSQPCILGSGGGIDARVGWRPSENFYLGGAYEFSKQDPGKLYRLAILQQARMEMRLYFPTGESAEPFVLFGAGLAGYGNEWAVATWGAGATFGGGLEVELSGGSLLNVSVAYRPIFLRSFEDSIPAFHEAGIAHFITLEIALEAQDTL